MSECHPLICNIIISLISQKQGGCNLSSLLFSKDVVFIQHLDNGKGFIGIICELLATLNARLLKRIEVSFVLVCGEKKRDSWIGDYEFIFSISHAVSWKFRILSYYYFHLLKFKMIVIIKLEQRQSLWKLAYVNFQT